MILLFGGTTEGRKALAVCEEAAKPFYYSTKGTLQQVETVHGIHLTGAMDHTAMESFCKEQSIRLIVDAAHPFAENLHQTIAEVSSVLEIPVVRLERNYPKQDKTLLWFDTYQEVIAYLEKYQIEDLLALTGTNTIAKLKPYWQEHACWFRILDRDESRSIAEKEGFPPEKIIYYAADGDEYALFQSLKPQAILTKESGVSGGFNAKIEAALQLNIPVLVVKRPLLSSSFIVVHGENGLRKQIEKLVPDFFALKTGYTTGSCATAATKAAFLTLLTGKEQTSVRIMLPNGELLPIPIFSTIQDEETVTCSVIKDGGDDPDVTHGHEIVSTVRLNPNHKEIHFLQGVGVGTVTLPGLDIPIGAPAINQTPRKMIREEVYKVKRHHPDLLPDGLKTGVDVTISVPEGEQLALKTFNPKLGIVGGISIIGTSGIVKPFSSEAFIASIRRELQVAVALGCKQVVINSGAKSERFVKQLYPDLIDQAYIHYGNFIGETIQAAASLGVEKLSMGIMIGKAVKLAEGSLDTHSKKVLMNKVFLTQLAEEEGCSPTTIQAIQDLTMARQLWTIIPPEEYRFFSILRQRCYQVCLPLFPKGELEVLLIDEEGRVVS